MIWSDARLSVIKYPSCRCSTIEVAAGCGALLAPEEGPMATVYDLVKDRRVYSIDADKTVLDAARFMMEHSIGALPVLRNGELVGIFSERDIMNRVVAAGRTPGTTRISEVMTANPRAIDAGESIEECLFLMKEFGFRHLPIVSGKQLKGLVSLRDLLLKTTGKAQSVA